MLQRCATVRTMAASSDPFVDPVVERYKRDVDRTLNARHLRLTPEQRIRQLMELQRFARELRRAGREPRR
jgi:hypothetical protein